MKLTFIQPNTKQLAKLSVGKLVEGFEPIDSDAIPPHHVMQRSIINSEIMADIWALPYFIKQSGKVIGCCGFKNAPFYSGSAINPFNISDSVKSEVRAVEIGYNVAPSVQGQGIATMAVSKLTQIAFDSGEVDKIVALIVPENKPSIAVVKKNGFVFREGVELDGELLEVWQVLK